MRDAELSAEGAFALCRQADETVAHNETIANAWRRFRPMPYLAAASGIGTMLEAPMIWQLQQLRRLFGSRSLAGAPAANHHEASAAPRASVVSRRFLAAVGGEPRWMPIVQR
jgi:hypothetical protein